MKWYIKCLQNYANFNGRASRSEYWYFVLFNLIFAFAAAFISAFLRMPILYYVYALGVLIPGIAVGVRRMHDTNNSGWFLLIPIYNLVLACTEGTGGLNDYGTDPVNPEPDFDFESAKP